MFTTRKRASSAPRFSALLGRELVRLFTRASTWWCAGLIVLVSLATSFMEASSYEGFPFGSLESSRVIPIRTILLPMFFVPVIAIVWGAFFATSEYPTGRRAAFETVTRQRFSNVIAKSIVLAVTVFLLCVATFGVSVVLTAAPLERGGMAIDWTEPWSSSFSLLIAASAMVMFALIGLSVGYLVHRRVGGTITAILVGVISAVTSMVYVVMIDTDESAGMERTVAMVAMALWTIMPPLVAAYEARSRDRRRRSVPSSSS